MATPLTSNLTYNFIFFRHFERVGCGQVYRKAEQDHDHQRQGPPDQGRHREDGQRGREVQERGRGSAGPDPGQERTRILLLQHEVNPGGCQVQR